MQGDSKQGMTEKTSDPQNWFLEKINKIYNNSSQADEEKKDGTNYNIRNERGYIKVDSIDIRSIIEYYEQETSLATQW